MRNWKTISDGETFESLVGTLLQAEIPGVVVFGRQGPDAGLDAISQDKTHVYQAKFHNDGLMGSAITSANQEFKKIKDKRDPHHRDYKYWKNVSDWTLIGNFKISPTDKEKWMSQIAPLFKSIDINAHFQGEEQLDLYLDRNPEIERSFFGGYIRTLIYPVEAYNKLSRQSQGGMFFATDMIGRASSMESVMKFAESPDLRILSVVGAYCSGRTRFLYEAMAAMNGAGWRGFWGLPESMSKSDAWFYSVDSSRRACVFIDDVNTIAFLREIVEQLSVNERSNWKLVFTCSHELARVLPFEITENAQFATVELPPLTRDDVAKIVTAYLNVDNQSPVVDGIADIGRGMPSLVFLMLGFYRKHRQLALPSNSLAMMDQYVSRSLEIVDRGLRDKAKLVLRWLSAWDGMSLGVDEETNDQLCFLQTLGVSFAETKAILKDLSETGLVDSWKSHGRDSFRVRPPLVGRHIIGSWLLEKDGDSYRVGTEGRELIGQLLRESVPNTDKIFQSIPAVLASYLSNGYEAERLFRPVFKHLEELTKNDDIENQYRIITMLEKIGIFAPESTLSLARFIFANPLTESRFLNRGSILHSVAKLLANVAEYVHDRPLAIQYVALFREIFESTPDEGGRPNSNREDVAKCISSVINHFIELRYFPDIALSLVLERLETGDMADHVFEQLLAKQLLQPSRESFELTSRRMGTFRRRAILCDSREWKRAIDIRDKLTAELGRRANPSERVVLWRLFYEGYQFAHNLVRGSIDHKHLPTIESARKLVMADLIFLKTLLDRSNSLLSYRDLPLMRQVWEWEYEYGGESEYKTMATECERRFTSKIGFPFQDLINGVSQRHKQSVKEAAFLFLEAKSADELDSFQKRVWEYFLAANFGNLTGFESCSFDEIAAFCLSNYDYVFDGADPVSVFAMRCLRRFDKDHPLSVAFATTMIRDFIRKQKSCLDQDSFETLFSRILSEAKDQDWFLKNVYGSGAKSPFGPYTSIEFEHLIASRMPPISLATVLPPWAKFDQMRVLARLSAALEQARESDQNSGVVLKMIVNGFYWALEECKELDDQDIPLLWIVEKINDGYAGLSLLEEYVFIELAKMKRCKLGMSAMLSFIDAVIQRERSGIYADDVDYGKFQPQVVFAIDDAAGFNKVCDLVVTGQSDFINANLGGIVSAVDADGKYTFNYIAQYFRTHSTSSRDTLARIACLIAYHKNYDTAKVMMKMVCERCLMMSREDRHYVYSWMTPSNHGVSWSLGVLPKEYLEAHKIAQEMYEREPDDSVLKDYYLFLCQQAEGTVRMIRDSITDDNHE